MENKKFNKLSIVAFVIILIVPVITILGIFEIYLPIDINIQKYIYILLFSIGFVLSRISAYKINKTGEKGKAFNYISLAIFTIVVGLIFIGTIISNQGHPEGKSVAIKSQLASMKAQGELFYQSNESYSGVCDASEKDNGFGGVKGPGLLSSVLSYTKEHKCYSNKDSWVVTANLMYKDTSDPNVYFCVDSTGFMKSITFAQNNLIINAGTLCSQ